MAHPCDHRGASDKEPFAKELSQQLLEERLANRTERIGRFLADDLKPGLSVIAAGERYCALASPDLFHLLTVQLGWTTEEHRAWLVSLLQADLLGRVRRRGSGSTSPRTHPC